MSEHMARRGPDGSGVWQRGPVALAHRRLTIIDLSRGRRAADGRHRARAHARLQRLHLQLPGAPRRARVGRVPVLLHLGHRGDREGLPSLGQGCVEHFHGMFAFAIAERDSGRLVLARDRLGIKPLYLARTRGRLRFASTLPALVAAGGVDTSIDRVALHHYMTFHSVVPAPLTILAGGAQAARRDGARGGAGRQRSRTPSTGGRRSRRPTAVMSAGAWQEALLAKLRLAVERRMVADVPVGVLLSGGLDSSLIVALLAESGQRGLKTFSIGFEAAGGESGDEFFYSASSPTRSGPTITRSASSSRSSCPPSVRRSRHERADDQPRRGRVLSALRGGQQGTSRSCSPARAPTRSSQVTTGIRRSPRCARPDALGAYAKVFFDRPRRDAPGHRVARVPAGREREPRVRRASTSRARARRRRSTRRCASTRRSCWSTTR